MAADCLHGAQSVPGPRSLNSPPSSAHGTKIALRGPGWFICRGSRTWHQKCPKISFGVSTPRSSSLGVVLKNRGDLLPSRSAWTEEWGPFRARERGIWRRTPAATSKGHLAACPGLAPGRDHHHLSCPSTLPGPVHPEATSSFTR